MALEQDEGNLKVLGVGIRKKPSAETGKDPSTLTPKKPMFFQKNFQKKETLIKKEVSSFRSKSKISKKGLSKDKFKLFKLDKRLLGSTIRIPLLGSSAKCMKTKDKLAATAQMSGSLVLVKEKSNSVGIGRTDQIRSFHSPKPLGFTFNMLCSTDTSVSVSPIVKEPEKTGNSANGFFNMSSSSQEIMSESKTVTNKIVVEDLIDLGSPEICKSRADHSDRLLPVSVMDKVGELEKELQPYFNSLIPYEPINSVKPYSLDSQNFMQSDITNSEVENLGSGVLRVDNKSTRDTELIKDDQNDSICRNSDFENDQCKTSHCELPNNSNWLDGKGGSPLVFYGFPGLNSHKEETQQILISHSRQTLVDHLNKNPFPKVVRENGQVRVRRRAFSMDDTLIKVIPCRPENVDSERTFVDKAPFLLINPVSNEASCSQNSGGQSQNFSEPIENLELSSLMVNESNCANDSDNERICSTSDEIVSGCFSQYSKDEILQPSTGFAIYKHKISMCSSNLTQEAENQFVPERESDPIPSSGFSNLNVSIDDSILNISDNLIESIPISNESKGEPVFTKDSSDSDENIPHTEDQSSQLTSDLNPSDRQFEVPEDTQPSKSSTEHVIEEPGDFGISFPERQVSLAMGTTTRSCSQNFEREIMNALDTEFEMGSLLNNSKVDEPDNNGIPSKKPLGQTQKQSSNEKEFSECSASHPAASLMTNPCKLEGESINGMRKELISNLDTIFITSQIAKSPGTVILLDAGLPLPEKVNPDSEEPNLEKDLQSSNHTLVDISAAVNDNGEMKEEWKENIAETSIDPTEEMDLPASLSFNDSDNDSIFDDHSCMTPLEHWVLPPGKKYRRSLSIIRNLDDEDPSANARRGRHYKHSVEEVIRLQGNNVEAWTPVQSLRQRLSMRRSSWMRQITPPPVRRNTFIWSPTIPNRGTLFESPLPRKSIYSTPMQHNLVHRMSVRASPMHGLRRSIHSTFNQDCNPASPVQYTIKDLILTICKQTEPCSFSDILNEDSYVGGCKLGEGVFGEVFSISRDGQNTVLKIIPIEGEQLVNGEKQKTYQEVLSELVIAKVLDELRYESSDESNQTSGYAQLIATSLVQGSYPKTLLRFWEEFDKTKGSDNENPKIFDDEQLFIVLEQGNGGKDVESYTFSSAKQSLSVLKQIAFSLAVAEISVEFEHRDLHWGNVLVSKTSEKQIVYTLNGTQYSVGSNGVKCTIIDYTLSRIKYINQFPIYNDIGKDPEMFIATGDFQFDIYRLMKKDVEDDWSRFAPKTNARWLQYLLDKMLTKVKYQRKSAKVHKDSVRALEEIGTWIGDCGSALSVALRLAESRH